MKSKWIKNNFLQQHIYSIKGTNKNGTILYSNVTEQKV